jgi:hypothetical protein
VDDEAPMRRRAATVSGRGPFSFAKAILGPLVNPEPSQPAPRDARPGTIPPAPRFQTSRIADFDTRILSCLEFSEAAFIGGFAGLFLPGEAFG